MSLTKPRTISTPVHTARRPRTPHPSNTPGMYLPSVNVRTSAVPRETVPSARAVRVRRTSNGRA